MVLLSLADYLCSVSVHDGLDALPNMRCRLAVCGVRVSCRKRPNESDGFFARAAIVLDDEGEDAQVGVSVAFAVCSLNGCMSVVSRPGLDEVMLGGEGRDHSNVHVCLGTGDLHDEIDPVMLVVRRGGRRVLFQQAWQSQMVAGVLVEQADDSIMSPHDSAFVACGSVMTKGIEAGATREGCADGLVRAMLPDWAAPRVAGPGDSKTSPE